MNLRPQPQNYSILFLDMNSFFASVEQQVQPSLRGRPIAITPYTGETGCVIAKSQAAKEAGIKTGNLVQDAKKACPQIIILESRPALYQFYHKEIVKLLQSFSPFLEISSIDEFYLRLSGRLKTDDGSQKLGREIKKAIKEKVGDYLTCSVGIGPNKFLAKVAGESQKPDGLVLIKLADLDQFYQKLKLLDLPGINYRMLIRLTEAGIKNPLDFYRADLSTLTRAFGHIGKVWYWRLRGYEVDDFVLKGKTVGHSYVLAPELRSWDKAREVLVKLVKKAGTRLRREHFWAQGISLGIGFLEDGWWGKSRRVGLFCDNSAFLKNIFLLFDECPKTKRPIHLALSAFDLVRSKSEPVSILPEIQKSRELSSALDQICDEFGPDAIYPASMYGVEDSAPDRIPFGPPRYDILNE